ncbi:MAG: hypothetical protein GWN31_08365, partial [Candidatus Thorarchaeota archaeon]|nr:hypothetical protein [Candidatus Thorarchaeota archaeon]
MLGQEFDRDVFLGQLKELTLDNDRIEYKIPTITLPRNFPVQGSIITDLSGDGQPEAAWIHNKVLNIFSQGEMVYESSEEMGGSLSQMSYSANPGIKESSMFTNSFEVPPVTHDLDGDNIPELFVLAAEGDFLNAPGVGPGIKKSWLA